MTVFNKNQVDHMVQPLFFGEGLNVARTETVKHRVIDDLSNKQAGFFWRPTEIDLTKDVSDYASLSPHEKHMFNSNIQYQSLLDSVQGRAPVMAFLPICSDPAYERWIETWSFSEVIHSESYTHIFRSLLPVTMTAVFNEILDSKEIMARADSVGRYYDNLLEFNAKRLLKTPDYNEYEHKKALYLCMHAVNALEAIRFFVSFAVTFSFGERKLLEGTCKIMSLIARDEALHLKGTQWTIRHWQRGLEGSEWRAITEECKEEAISIFTETLKQEKEWAKHLMSLGTVVGLNENILCKYAEFIADQRMRVVGLLDATNPIPKNPIPWINNWLNSSDKQVAPQEVELGSYITGGLSTNNVSITDFEL